MQVADAGKIDCRTRMRAEGRQRLAIEQESGKDACMRAGVGAASNSVRRCSPLRAQMHVRSAIPTSSSDIRRRKRNRRKMANRQILESGMPARV